MDFDEAPELRTLREVARQVAGSVAAGPGEPEPDAATVWAALSAQGWSGLAVPEQLGGAGAELPALAVVSAECARAGLPSTLRSTLCAALLIDGAGDQRQRDRWLPRLAGGAAATACSAGAAELVGDVLTGQLTAVPDLDLAAFVAVVLPRVDRVGAAPSGWRLCVLDPVAAQIRLHGSVSGRPLGRLRGADLGPEQIDAGPALDEAGSRRVAALLAALTAADLVGAADGLLARTVAHVCTREQFGRPLGAFQAVQHHVADMATALEGARLLVDDAITRLAGAQPAHREVAAAKAYAGRAATTVSLLAHQLHGAIGYVTESGLHLLSRRVESDALLAGSAAEHLDELAERYRHGPARTLGLDALDDEPTPVGSP
jgi:alkylation response protein AidB-like acyl-CoA dehydrogenase